MFRAGISEEALFSILCIKGLSPEILLFKRKGTVSRDFSLRDGILPTTLFVLFCLSCSACPLLPTLFCLSCSACPVLACPVLACPVLAVPSWCPVLVSCSSYPVLAVLFRLPCFGCPVPNVLFRLSSSGCPVPVVLFWLFFLAVLSWMSCPGRI